MDDGPYSADLTAEEQELGFSLMEVKNPRGEFAFASEKVQAVVKRLGPSDRIIKMNDPIEFKHQRYGHFGTRRVGRLDWLPVGMLTYPTVVQAVNAIESGRAEATEAQSGMSPRITAADPGDDF